jgi:hypothetical protein
MKYNHSLDLINVFFEALKYPQFARPNFFINEQRKSEWSKGVYLTALDEVYHNSVLRLRLHFNAKKKSLGDIKFEEFKISKKILSGGDDEQFIDKQILDELHYAIRYAWQFDTIQKSYSSYQIISFVEFALLFIKNEFYEQAKKTSSPHPRPRTKTYFTYLIAQNGPFFDFPKFKNVVRELLYTTRNVKRLENLLISFHKIAVEIVDLWNEEIYFIEQNLLIKEDNPEIERVRVEFHADTLEKSWWSDDKLFDNLPHKPFMNQDFAIYAANIANLINSEIIHGVETKIKIVKKKFLDDFIRGIKHLTDKNDSEIAIRNVLEGINHEAPFRDFFATWFEGAGYKANREPLRGENHIDLKVEHPSVTRKIIEFKGWWNPKKYLIVHQLFNYLTQFDEEGYIFIINHSGKSIEDLYRENITKDQNGYIGDWRSIPYKHTAFKYFLSKHKIEGQTKLVYHFILDIQKPKKIRKA